MNRYRRRGTELYKRKPVKAKLTLIGVILVLGGMNFFYLSQGVIGTEIVEIKDVNSAHQDFPQITPLPLAVSRRDSLSLYTSQQPLTLGTSFAPIERGIEWNRTYGGGEADAGISVMEVSTGGFACVGYTASSGAGAADVWLVRTAVDGTPQWTQTYGGTEDDHGHSIQEIAAGGFIILGSTESYGSGSKDSLPHPTGLHRRP